MNRCSFVVP